MGWHPAPRCTRQPAHLGSGVFSSPDQPRKQLQGRSFVCALVKLDFGPQGMGRERHRGQRWEQPVPRALPGTSSGASPMWQGWALHCSLGSGGLVACGGTAREGGAHASPFRRRGSRWQGGLTLGYAFDLCPDLVSDGSCFPNYPLRVGLVGLFMLIPSLPGKNNKKPPARVCVGWGRAACFPIQRRNPGALFI